jgi:hypothetical protein
MCNTKSYSGLVADSQVVDKLLKQFKCKTCRIIAPNSLYSEDYEDTRLNIVIKNDESIEEVWVG